MAVVATHEALGQRLKNEMGHQDAQIYLFERLEVGINASPEGAAADEALDRFVQLAKPVVRLAKPVER